MPATLNSLLTTARDIVASADDTGCTDDLTVVSASAVERLRAIIEQPKRRRAAASGIKPNAMQVVACKVYGGGDFAHYADNPNWERDIEDCGDTLFRFIMSELGDDGDSMDWETAVQRMNTATRDVQNVLDALIDDPRNVDTENTTGHVDPTFGGCA